MRDAYKEFIKTKSKYPKTRAGVSRAMKAAATQISKAIKDIKVQFKVTKSYNLEGGASPGNPHHFEMTYNTQDAYEDWTTSEYMFDNWLNSFMNLVKHELVHIEQYRRILKNKGDIEKVADVLFDTQAKAEKKYHTDMETYLSTHIEIMAHAKQAAEDLKGFDQEQLLDDLKDSETIQEVAGESYAFDSYYSWIKPNYPKVWKKFIKYLIQYIERRIK
jgi:hypothetical protein